MIDTLTINELVKDAEASPSVPLKPHDSGYLTPVVKETLSESLWDAEPSHMLSLNEQGEWKNVSDNRVLTDLELMQYTPQRYVVLGPHHEENGEQLYSVLDKDSVVEKDVVLPQVIAYDTAA